MPEKNPANFTPMRAASLPSDEAIYIRGTTQIKRSTAIVSADEILAHFPLNSFSLKNAKTGLETNESSAAQMMGVAMGLVTSHADGTETARLLARSSHALLAVISYYVT